MNDDLDLEKTGIGLSQDELTKLFNLHEVHDFTEYDDISITTTRYISLEPKIELKKIDTTFSNAFELYEHKVEAIPKLLHPFLQKVG